MTAGRADRIYRGARPISRVLNSTTRGLRARASMHEVMDSLHAFA